MTDDVASAQRQLGRAFDRARMGEDRQLATEVREKGEQLAMTLHGLLRMSRIHAADNKAFDRPVEELRVVLERLVALLGVVHLATVEDQVYVNDIRVHLPLRSSVVGEASRSTRSASSRSRASSARSSSSDGRYIW